MRQFLYARFLLELWILEIHIFRTFFPTCFDILSWIIAYTSVILNYRSNSSVVNLRQCLKEVCPFWNLEYWSDVKQPIHLKYSFLTYLLHTLTYWAEILNMTLFNCTTDEVRVSSILELRILEIKFSALFPCMFWPIELKFRIWLCLTVLNIKFECRQFPSIFVGVMSLLELKYTFFRTFLQHVWTYLAEISHMPYTVTQIEFECRPFTPVFVGGIPLLERRILKIQFSALFSCVLWHIELKFWIWL